MTLTEFLLARITEDEQEARDAGASAMLGSQWKYYPRDAYDEIQAATLARCRRTLAACEAHRLIVKLHEQWPVLVETEPKFEAVDQSDPSSMTFRMSKQIAWTTEQQYREHFGTEPPSAPMLLALAALYSDHPDYRDEWRP